MGIQEDEEVGGTIAAILAVIAFGEGLVRATWQARAGARDFPYRTLDGWSRTRRVTGKAENRIGELFADRASSATMAANQLRMSFAAMACVVVDTLRRVGLSFTQFADASAQTNRLKPLKLGAQVRTSVRHIHFAIASGCPNKDAFALTHIYLQRAFSPA